MYFLSSDSGVWKKEWGERGLKDISRDTNRATSRWNITIGMSQPGGGGGWKIAVITRACKLDDLSRFAVSRITRTLPLSPSLIDGFSPVCANWAWRSRLVSLPWLFPSLSIFVVLRQRSRKFRVSKRYIYIYIKKWITLASFLEWNYSSSTSRETKIPGEKPNHLHHLCIKRLLVLFLASAFDLFNTG